MWLINLGIAGFYRPKDICFDHAVPSSNNIFTIILVQPGDTFLKKYPFPQDNHRIRLNKYIIIIIITKGYISPLPINSEFKPLRSQLLQVLEWTSNVCGQ